MKIDTFDFIYTVVIVVIVFLTIFLAIGRYTVQSDCLSKYCDSGRPFFDGETGNCFCAEVPK